MRSSSASSTHVTKNTTIRGAHDVMGCTGAMVRHNCSVAINKKYSAMGVENWSRSISGKKEAAVKRVLDTRLSP